MKKLISLLLLFAGGAFAEPQDNVFLEAREAFQRGDIARLERQAAELKEDYPLRSYVQYWLLRSRLNDSDEAEVEEFLDQHRGDLVAERLRADWLRQLALRGKWDDFLRQYSELGTPDTELACRAAQARMLKGEAGALTRARSQWFTAQVLPDDCQPLFKAMFDLQILSAEDTWARIRLTLESGNVGAAKRLVGYLPADQRAEARDFAEIGRRPLRYLDRTPLPLKTQAQREMAIYALYRHAATAPKNAVERLRGIAPQLSQEEQHYAWAQVAAIAARNLHPEAHNWFAEPARMNDRQLTWQARSSLRAGDWSGVLSAIDAMTAPERKLPQWRYWKARALAALSRQDEANELFEPLSNEFNYYGQLAAEEVGTAMSFAPQTYRPEPEDVEAVAGEPGIRRALQLYRAGLRYEGALEWQWTIREYDDKQLLAAAELAMRNDWFERAIDTAERTVLLHDFSLRYPTPYRTLVQYNAQQLGLDEAWIYGLVRQESRFVHTARSSAGASGLMQLMPSTARWAARRLGLNRHHATLTETVDTNISMGTFYLKQVLDSLGNNLVLASAGYNAGPGRAREWLADRPLEGAIYVESIPFPETREYIKRVMNNALYYSRLFREPGPGLRERLGTVPARELQRN